MRGAKEVEGVSKYADTISFQFKALGNINETAQQVFDENIAKTSRLLNAYYKGIINNNFK